MKKGFIITIMALFFASLVLSACQTIPAATNSNTLKVVAAESFLADIAANVAGDRATVESLMPREMDPHAFEPVPSDVAKIADSPVVIINGGIEGWLDKLIQNAGGEHKVIVANSGLPNRTVREGEIASDEEGGDPHFWLDPISVIKYVENIRDGLTTVDPEGKDVYTKNAETYIAKLKDLDAYLREQAQTIPAEKRLIVTNHESFGYFADRYDFKLIGTIVPSVSSGASPSAQQLARLVDHIKETGATAIFLETGTNPQLAEQVAKETGIKVVTDLYTHSITASDGIAPTYIDMMKYNMSRITENLK